MSIFKKLIKTHKLRRRGNIHHGAHDVIDTADKSIDNELRLPLCYIELGDVLLEFLNDFLALLNQEVG
jgi:hypothetical protein